MHHLQRRSRSIIYRREWSEPVKGKQIALLPISVISKREMYNYKKMFFDFYKLRGTDFPSFIFNRTNISFGIVICGVLWITIYNNSDLNVYRVAYVCINVSWRLWQTSILYIRCLERMHVCVICNISFHAIEQLSHTHTHRLLLHRRAHTYMLFRYETRRGIKILDLPRVVEMTDGIWWLSSLQKNRFNAISRYWFRWVYCLREIRDAYTLVGSIWQLKSDDR